MKNNRTTEIITTDTPITVDEYLLLLCQALEAARQTELTEQGDKIDG